MILLPLNDRTPAAPKEPDGRPPKVAPRAWAAVPDERATAWSTPQRSASSASKASRSGPTGATQPESRAASRAARSAGRTSGGESQMRLASAGAAGTFSAGGAGAVVAGAGG